MGVLTICRFTCDLGKYLTEQDPFVYISKNLKRKENYCDCSLNQEKKKIFGRLILEEELRCNGVLGYNMPAPKRAVPHVQLLVH